MVCVGGGGDSFSCSSFSSSSFFSRDVSTLYARWVFPKTVIILGVLLLLRRRRLAFGAATSR